MAYNRKEQKIKSNFKSLRIGLSSPEVILQRSNGEVIKPETINYRSYKPEMGGLFCERIFGPTKDYECHCGKYKRIRYKGIVCDRCGVEVTEKKVRRERMGHIELVVPVAHIWYFRSLPNKIGYLLGLPSKKLDMIIYYERYVVIQPGLKEEDGINYLDFLTEEEYLDILDTLPKENQYLEDNDPNINSMKPRTIDAIYLGPVENYQGGHLVLNINTWKPIRRAKIWQVLVTETICKTIEVKAKQDDVTSFKFLNRNKVDIDV